MLASAAVHSPAWRSQGYVCLACRRALAQAETRAHRRRQQQQPRPQSQQHQVRWSSQQPVVSQHQQSPMSSPDSWFESLNDISKDFASPPRRPSSSTRPKQDENRENEARNRAKLSRSLASRASKKSHSSMTSPPRTPQGNVQTGLSDCPNASPDVGTSGSTIAHVKEQDHGTADAEKAKTQLEGQTADVQSPESEAWVQAIGQSTLFNAYQLRSLTTRLRKETNSHAVQQDKARRDNSPVSVVDRPKLDEVMRDLELSLLSSSSPVFKEHGVDRTRRSAEASPSKDAIVTENVEPEVLTSKEALSTTEPSWSVPHSIKNHTVGWTLDELQRSPRAEVNGANDTTENAFLHSQHSTRPIRLVDRHRQHLRSLTPFGMLQMKAASDPASFESLRGADKVTPKIVTASAVNDTPFGLSSATTSASLEVLDRLDVERISLQQEDALAVPAEEHAQTTDDQAQTRLRRLYVQQGARPTNADKLVRSSKGKPPPKPETLKSRKLERRKRRTSHESKFSTPTIQAEAPVASNAACEAATQATSKQKLSIAQAMDSPRGRKALNNDDQVPEPTIARSDIASVGIEAANSLIPSTLQITPLDVPQPPVPYLQYGLDRVLFNPGVYQLQDADSRVYNFDPYLQNIMPVKEFNFDALKEYKTSSKDAALSALAREHDKKYIGSTSSMTSSLAHLHYLLSNWRPLNLEMLSKGFVTSSTKPTFTEINRTPSAIFLRWQNGTYAIDADKEHDSANVLMLLGKSMELLLTLPKDDFERYRKSNSRQVPADQITTPDSYQYTTIGDFLMRSQLDAHDPRLPGNGNFDLKTRAVVSVRMSAQDYEQMTGYEIFSLQGKWASYEREYFDMMRSTMLKYMLQARMGRMNGIFVAYHNVKRIFGFQYLPIHEMDRVLHGQKDTCLGDQEFKASLNMLNEVLNRATEKFPEQSLRLHFETRPGENGRTPTALHIFAEPMADEQIDTIQNSQQDKIAAWERDIMGKDDWRTDTSGVDHEHAASDAEARDASHGDPSADVIVAEHTAAAQKDQNDTMNEVDHEVGAIASSDSSADIQFLDAMAQECKQDLKPLFHATIIMQSRVNGQIPDGERPRDLSSSDKWEIDYILKEYETTRSQWALYEDTKSRRKYALSQEAEEEDDAEEKKNDYYIRFLKDMAAKGGELREKIDELDAGQKVVRVDNALPKERETIAEMEDYMSWLYKKGT